MNDVTWWRQNPSRTDSDGPADGTDVPGDTNASDIVGRTGEEMPDVAHDEGDLDLPISEDAESDDDSSLPT